MNILKTLALCLLTAVFAFAQAPAEEQPAPVSPDSSAVPIPTPIPPTVEAIPVSSSSETAIVLILPPQASSSSSEVKDSSESKSSFDSLRGHAYNPYGTVGASTAIGDLITTPSDINGQRFFYISPTDYLGYTAFGFNDGTALLGLDNSPGGTPAALVLGYANSAFGFAVSYSVSKTWADTSYKDVNRRDTHLGDNIGLYLSMPLNSGSLYANARWLTYKSYIRNYEGNETKTDDSDIEANIGLTDKLGSLSYDGFVHAIRTGETQVLSNGDKLVDTAAYFGFSLNFNIGYPVLQNSYARVIAGMNNKLYFIFYDKTTKSDIGGDNKIGYRMIPNILADISLFDNWIAFAGAAHVFSLIAGDGDRNTKTSKLDISHSYFTEAFAGIRYQRTNWAVEAHISNNLFNNPFYYSKDNNNYNMFAGFGGFVYF